MSETPMLLTRESEERKKKNVTLGEASYNPENNFKIYQVSFPSFT